MAGAQHSAANHPAGGHACGTSSKAGERPLAGGTRRVIGVSAGNDQDIPIAVKGGPQPVDAPVPPVGVDRANFWRAVVQFARDRLQ